MNIEHTNLGMYAPILECIEKVREGRSNTIVKYIMRDTSTGQIINMGRDELRNMMILGSVGVMNLRLSADNRIIDVKQNNRPTQTSIG